MAINFSAQFIVNEKTSSRVLRLTDTSTGFTLSKGNFIITFPDGSVASNTDFASPQISAPGGNTNVSLITDIDNTVLTGTYVITYVALDTSLNQYSKTETFDFNWEKPTKAIINDSDVVLPEVQFKDLTAYETSGSFTGVLTRNFYTTTPSTSEVGVITKTSAGDILTPSNASKYYEGIYLAKSDISVAYTHTSKSWLTVSYVDLLQETFDVREAPTQDELVALMNTYKDQIEAYKSTNPSQYEIMNEQYDLVLALYSHIIARYQTTTLDGSKAILDQLLGLLPPASSYTYKATQMLPFTINFSTALTGTGTTGTLPKFTGTTTLGDSIIKEDTSRIGIGKTPTTTLDVNGTIQGTSIVKSGGISTQFLKADGSVDASTYLTTGSASSTYQPLDGDLTAIAVLAGAAGILTKVSANTWSLDTTSYQVLDADLTAIAALAGTSGFLKKTSANTWELDTTSYQVLDADLTAIAALTGTSGILIKTAANTWSLDTATYQLADADLTAIAALAGTSGLIRKTAANTYELDTSAYLTGITSGQITTALGYTPENAANKGVNNGYAGLDGTGKVPSTQLPSYVDDVIEAANVAALPATGETGKIYITLDTNKVYRWTGSVYVEISSSTAVWGGITGTLSNQTDLQTALDAKLNVTTAASTYYLASNPNGYTTNAGTVTSVAMSVPSAFSVSGSPIASSGTLAVTATGDTTQYIDGTGALQTFPVLSSADKLILVVRNNSGATITKGTVVYINGIVGNKPTIAKALATGDATSAQTLGLLQADIANNSNGNVVLVGSVIDLDTSAFTEGQQLYLSGVTAGTYTATKTLAPTHLVYVGVITRAHPTQGVIEVKIQNGYELHEIHDVSITSVANNQGLFYESSTSLWKNKSIDTALGFTPQRLDKMVSNLLASDTEYPNSNAVLAKLALKADAANPVFTGAMTISGAEPKLYFTDTDNNPDYSIFADAGYFYIYNQTSGASRFYITDTGVSNIPGDLIVGTIAKSGGTSSQFLKADGSVDINTYALNSALSSYLLSATAATTYQPLDGDLTAIAALAGTSGLLKKTAADTYTLDTAAYITASSLTPYLLSADAVTTYQRKDKMVSNLLASDTEYPNSNAVLAKLALKADASNPVFTGDLSISGITPRLYFVDTDNNPDYTIFVDSGYFYIYDQTAGASKFQITPSGNAVNAGTLTSSSFIKSGGTSAQFLKADGSVDSTTYGTGTVTSVAALTLGTTGTDLSSTVATGTTTPVITLNVPTASAANRGALSAADWTTFNNKASTAALANYLPLAGGTLTGALSGTSASFTTNLNWGNTSGSYMRTVGGTQIFASSYTGSNYLYSGSDTFRINNQADTATLFTLTNTGAATFIDTTDITANNSTAIHLVLRGRAADSVGQMEFWNNAKSIRYGYIATDSTSYGIVSTQAIPLVLGTNSSEKMRITSAGNVGIGTTSPEGKLTIQGTSAQPPTSGTTANSLLQLVGSLGAELNIGSCTVTGGYGSYIQASDNNLAVSYPLLLQPNGGNVGIGTTAPNGKLDVRTAGQAGVPALGTAGSGINISRTDGLTGGSIGYTTEGHVYIQSQRFDSANANNLFLQPVGGNVGIGTILPSVLLHLSGSSGEKLRLETTTSTANFIGFYTGATRTHYFGKGSGGSNDLYCGIDSSANIIFDTNATERMRITSGGELLIGTTTDSGDYKLQVSGNVYATAYFESSDKRLKDINYLQNSETFGAAQFTWKDKRDEKNHYGYIAQEVAKFVPDAVIVGNDGLLSVDYNQAHTFKIAKVEDEVTLLKKRVAELEQQLNIL